MRKGQSSAVFGKVKEGGSDWSEEEKTVGWLNCCLLSLQVRFQKKTDEQISQICTVKQKRKNSSWICGKQCQSEVVWVQQQQVAKRDCEVEIFRI